MARSRKKTQAPTGTDEQALEAALGEETSGWVASEDLPPLPAEQEDLPNPAEGHTHVYMHAACNGAGFYLDAMPHPSSLLRLRMECRTCGKSLGPLSIRHVRPL